MVCVQLGHCRLCPAVPARNQGAHSCRNWRNVWGKLAKGRIIFNAYSLIQARLKPWEFKNYVCKGIQVQEPTAAAGALHSYGQEEAYGNKMDDEQVENIPMKTEQPIATVNYR